MSQHRKGLAGWNRRINILCGCTAAPFELCLAHPRDKGLSLTPGSSALAHFINMVDISGSQGKETAVSLRVCCLAFTVFLLTQLGTGALVELSLDLTLWNVFRVLMGA